MPIPRSDPLPTFHVRLTPFPLPHSPFTPRASIAALEISRHPLESRNDITRPPDDPGGGPESLLEPPNVHLEERTVPLEERTVPLEERTVPLEKRTVPL